MPYVSRASSLDRLLPCLPPLAFGDRDFLQSVAVPVGEAERYRRLRVHRALGCLPSHVFLSPALTEPRGRLEARGTGPNPAGGVGEGGENGRRSAALDVGQYTGDVSAVSWNSQALFCADLGRYDETMSLVAGLATGHDVIMLQEAHGSPGVYEAWSGIRGFTSFFFVRLALTLDAQASDC